MSPVDKAVRVQAFIQGRVQGVCYRWAARDEAKSLCTVGWVRNLPDGKVELVAEGPRSALEKLVSWCHAGPPAAQVSEVKLDWLEPTGEFSEFSIRY